MHVRQPIAIFSSLLQGIALATPAAAQAGSVSAFVLTPGRLTASLAALVGLIGVATGGLALTRARGSGNALPRATFALLAGLFSMTLGGLVVATAKGGLGTGHGLGGGVVALVAGSMSVALAVLTRIYARRAD